MKKGLIAVIVVVILGALGYLGFSYWNNTYNGQVSYAVVPDNPVKTKSKTSNGGDYKQNGKQVYHYAYDFHWVNAAGQAKDVSWDGPESTNPTALKPGSYVTGKVSKERVTEGPNPIAEGQIPDKAKANLK